MKALCGQRGVLRQASQMATEAKVPVTGCIKVCGAFPSVAPPGSLVARD